MALIRCSFRSTVLDMEVLSYVALPGPQTPTEKLKTLYLFHEEQENCSGISRSLDIESYCRQYHLAAVMPDFNRPYYEAVYEKDILDHFLWRELPQTMAAFFPLSSAPKDQYLFQNTDQGALITPLAQHGDCLKQLQLPLQNRANILTHALFAAQKLEVFNGSV